MNLKWVRTRKTLLTGAGVLFVVVVALVAMVMAAAGTEIDMTIADNSVAYNDAIFKQGPLDVNSAGTGVIDPFLSVGGGGSQDITKGYNTVDSSAEFDTVTGGDRTRPLLLSGVPEIEIGGQFYREFKLDINKAKGGNPYLALNELKLFLTNDFAITGYDYEGGTEFGANATKVWDLGDAVVLMNYGLAGGSGNSDVSFFVKSSLFATDEDCSYGSSACTTYVVMWNEFGNYSGSSLYPNRTWENNDGFEEWGVVLRPVVDAEKTAEGTFDRTIDWDIFKSVDPPQHDMFIGDSDSSTYEIELVKNESVGNASASGTITVDNPTGCGDETCPVPENVLAEILSVEDVIDQSGLTTEATVTCPVTFPYTLGGGETLVCTYTASTPNADAGTNKATITVEVPQQIGGGTDTYETFAELSFTENTIGYEKVNVDDTNDAGDGGPFGNSTTHTYDGDFSCPTDTSLYDVSGLYSFTHPNTATIVETGDSDDALVTVNCYIWDVSKTADGTYQDRYDWVITKTVDPETQSGFAGDTLEWEWTITWNSSFVEEINYAVSGVITVDNPAPLELTVDVTDYLTGDLAATVVCNDGNGGTSLTIPANGSGTCNYSAAPGSKLAQNTATATRNSVSVSDTVNVNWTKTGDVGLDATISDSNNVDIPVDSAKPFRYTESVDCSTIEDDYGEDGSYSGSASNTAAITWTGGSDSSTANTAYTCYIWDVSKTANGSYQGKYGWDITKTVDPESQSGFAGDTLEWEWSITWGSYFIGEVNHAVSGVITVDNPAPIELTVNVTDYLTGNFAAAVTCNDGDGGASLTIAANSSSTCDYSAAPGSQLAQNTATATRNSVSVSDTVDVNWTKTGDVGLDATISDSNHADIPTNSVKPYKYTQSADCSTDQGAYGEDGSYSGSASNTAEITWTGGSDSSTANTAYTCYIWDVSKTANGSYQDKYRWEITKTVDPSSQTGNPGKTLEWTWSITWEPFFVEEIDHAVSGIITVSNPNPDAPVTVDVTDYLTGDLAATVVCNDADHGTSLTITANSSGTCDYSANPGSTLPQNTATATRSGVSVSDTVNVNWTKTGDVGLDAKISDSNRADIPADTTQPYEYTELIVCSTEREAYGETGSYSGFADNTATVTWTDGFDSDSAHTEWTCEASFVDIYKTTNGQPADPTKDIVFKLYDDSGNELETQSTFGNGADIQFDTALVPEASYTICENPVPAGYTFEISVNGGNVLTYAGPPGEANPTGEIQCFDFTADPAGNTLTFNIENSFPGGAPRTPGYWKNWNTCSNGNQAETAEKLGGVAEGVYLLDNLLPQTVGNLVIPATEDGCQIGVYVLDSRWAVDEPGPGNKTLKAGTQASNDAAYELARNYLAARLNQDAGACDPDGYTFPIEDNDSATFEQVLTEAQTFLVKIGYDGAGDLLTPKMKKLADERVYALYLAGILDDYNNSKLCTGEPSH